MEPYTFEHLGKPYGTGCILGQPLKFEHRRYGEDEHTPIVPSSDWEAIARSCNGDQPSMPIINYIHDQNGYGMCFPKGTLIRMADGSLKPIESISVLDSVLTAAGNVGTVKQTMVRKANELVRVHIWGSRHLRCTPEHPILTRRGFVKAKDLKARDFVAMPRYAPQSIKMIQTADYLENGRAFVGRNKVIRSRVYGGIPGKKASTVVVRTAPDVIELDAAFGRIIGFFLSEGCTSLGKVVWTFGKHEENTHAAELVQLIDRVFGQEAKVRLAAANSCHVTLHGVHWAKLFEKWCALGAAGKRLHADLASGPLEFLESVLSAWTDGDGLGDDRCNGGVTVSHALAVGMFDIANALGYRPTIETLEMKTYGQVASRQKRYIVKWGKNIDRPDDSKSMLDDTHMWRRVCGVVHEDFDGWVYNFEVEGEHTYVAESIGVHNCNASATASALEHQNLMVSGSYDKLSAGDLYNRISGGSDNGSTLEDGLMEAKNGIASTSEVPYLEWRRRSAGTTRSKARVLEWWLARSFEECYSGVCRGFSLITGIMWYDNFTPDSQGRLPSRGRGQPGGHAIHGYKAGWIDGKPYIWHKNSWTESYGLRGHMAIGREHYDGDIGGWWLVRLVTAPDTGDKLPAPK